MLLYHGGEYASSNLNIIYLGGLVMVVSQPSSKPVVDRIILCGSSVLSEAEAVKILKEEFYIVSKNH